MTHIFIHISNTHIRTHSTRCDLGVIQSLILIYLSNTHFFFSLTIHAHTWHIITLQYVFSCVATPLTPYINSSIPIICNDNSQVHPHLTIKIATSNHAPKWCPGYLHPTLGVPSLQHIWKPHENNSHRLFATRMYSK
jgi:hypothetical protein